MKVKVIRKNATNFILSDVEYFQLFANSDLKIVYCDKTLCCFENIANVMVMNEPEKTYYLSFFKTGCLEKSGNYTKDYIISHIGQFLIDYDRIIVELCQ